MYTQLIIFTALTSSFLTPSNNLNSDTETDFLGKQEIGQTAMLSFSLSTLPSDIPPPQKELFIMPPPPEPEIYFEPISLPIDTLLTEVTVVAPYRDDICGCVPNYPDPIAIAIEDIEEVELSEQDLLPEPVYVDPYIFTSRVYPNPANAFTTVELETEQDGQFQINVYNISGAKVMQVYEGMLYAGRQQFRIELNDLSTGLYLIQVRSEKHAETFKIQKL